MKLDFARLGFAGLTGLIWVAACFTLLVGFQGDLSLVAVILLCFFVFASIMLWRTILDPSTSPMTLMFWIYHVNFLFLPGLAQVLHRRFFWSSFDSYPQESLLFTCMIIGAGLGAFMLGSMIGQARVRSLDIDMTEKGFLLRRLRSTWTVQLFFLVILAGLTAYIAAMGLDFFIATRRERPDIPNEMEMGLIVNLPRAIAAGVLLFSVYLLVRRWRELREVQFPIMFIFVLALAVNAIINYPLGQARFWFFGMLICLLWIVMPLSSVKLRIGFLLGITLMQFTLFPWYSQITRETGLFGFALEDIRAYMTHGDFDSVQTITNSLIYIRDRGFEYGRNLLSVLLFFVPRSVWNKAEPLGAASSEHMGYEFTNLSAPIYGELFADFGLFSLLTGMLLLGYWLKILDAHYHQMTRENRYGAGVLLTSVLAGYLIILLRGSLLAVISNIATLFGLLVVSTWLASASSSPVRQKRVVMQGTRAGRGPHHVRQQSRMVMNAEGSK